MKVYFSGICGTGLGPLALFAQAAGYEVVGSDLMEGAILPELEAAGIRVKIGAQDGENLLAEQDRGKISWLVYSSALEEGHPELGLAKKLGLRVSKRDEFIAGLVEEKGLKMVAVAGTHGKTTTTSMIIWAALKLGLPVSWLVGTTLGFMESGKYNAGAEFLIYEADEYDRNFLHYFPWLAVLVAVSYDHPDIYPSPEDYSVAFRQFKAQSREVIELAEEGDAVDGLTLVGERRRADARLAMRAIRLMAEAVGRTVEQGELVEIMNQFPGVGRRFERITEGVYSDYAHHPEEIEATIQLAQEEAERTGERGVVAIYEPHQNTRQAKLGIGYKTAFEGVTKLFWLPTYLTREDPEFKVISPEEFIRGLSVAERAEPAEMNGELAEKLRKLREEGYLILLMTAGPADVWLRGLFPGDA